MSGGEIFLRGDLEDLVSLIIKTQKRLALLHFPTNGFFTDKITKLVNFILQNSKVKLIVTISLDGYEELHNYIKGINSWRRSIDTYRELKKIRNSHFKVFLGYTLNNFNFDKIDKTLEELRKEFPYIKYSDIHINIIHTSEHYYSNLSASIDKKGIETSVDNYIGKRKYKLYNPIDYLEYKYHAFIKDYLGDNRTPLSCRSLINSIFIDPEGNVFPCSIYNKNLGNLRDNDYDLNKMLKSKQADILREDIGKHACPQCWTPCEAYQMILASFLKLSTRQLFLNRS
jgi:sulfatase maturation enzyme AslB (radical SAM superfamily)